MFFLPPAAITGALEFGSAALTFIVTVFSKPSILLFWRKKKPGPAQLREHARADEVRSHMGESLKIAEDSAIALDNIIAKLMPTKAELHEMSKLELQIVANAHEIRFKKKTTKREMISTIVHKLKL